MIAVNNSYLLAPWADLLYACDYRWWDRYRPQFSGMKLCPDEATARKFEIDYIKGEHRPGLSLDKTRIHFGGNSGFQALNVAVHCGASKIILLGFDMREVSGKKHWHGDHVNIGNPQKNTFARWILAFNEAAPQLRKLGLTVLNCTPGSALTCFPFSTVQDALR